MKQVSITVNGKEYQRLIPEEMTLLAFLREEAGLTGTKEGCGEGACGACSILVDRRLVNSCCYLACEANGKRVLTVVGLNRKDRLHPLQQIYLDAGAVQCGFCTPGMIMATIAIYAKNRNPSEEEIRKGMSGNLCRCTGYVKILEAVRKAGEDVSWLDDICW